MTAVTAASGTATQTFCSQAAHATTPSAVTGRVATAAPAASRHRARTRTAPSIRSMTRATPTAAKALDTAAASVAGSQVSGGAPAADPRVEAVVEGVTASKTATATATSAAARAQLNTSFSGRRYWRRSTPNPTRAPATRVSTSTAGPSDISARKSGTSLRKTERASRRSCTLTTRAWVATKIPSRTTAGTGRPGGAA